MSPFAKSGQLFLSPHLKLGGVDRQSLYALKIFRRFTASALPFRKKPGDTEGQTDVVQHLIRPAREPERAA